MVSLGSMANSRDAPPPEPAASERPEVEPTTPERTSSTTTLPLVGRQRVMLGEQGRLGGRADEGPTGSLHRRLEERLAQEPTPILWRMSGDGQAERVPEQIGPYRIVSLLGEGGMGTVYLAEQTEPIRRQVAIKLIHPNLMGRQAVLRFEAERQALARMQHPNIAQVFDAGTTEDGCPFVVMEALQGEPVTGYCDRRKLDLQQRLDVFRQVCAGVQHAHQKGVLHRDLKPSNVLVEEADDGRPRVKIIDFGVAKALDDPLVDATQLTGDRVVGTPAYLSPESIDMPEQGADVRADVYALGVILYQLLCGCRPFERTAEGHVEFLWRIVKEEPRRPSERFTACSPEQQVRLAAARGEDVRGLQRRLGRELDWVAIKTIAKEREQRYASVSDLDADIARYLRDDPVVAGSPGRLYRLGKLVRRHRLLVAAAVLLVLTLVGGIVARTLEAQRANREAAAARQAEEEARRAEEETRQVVNFLTDMFEVADPSRRTPEQPVTAREVLDRASRTIDTDLQDQPRVRLRLLATLADVYTSLGVSDRALELTESALALASERFDAPQPEYARLVQVHAIALWQQGRIEDAEAAFEDFLRLGEASQDEHELADALMNFATFYSNQGQFEQAEEMFRRGWQLEARNVPGGVLRHVRHISNFGGVLARRGKLDEATTVLSDGISFAEQHLRPNHPLVAALANNLGNAYLTLGDLDAAIPLYKRAIEIREEQLGPEDISLASTLSNLASALTRSERFQEAETIFRRSLAIREAHLGPDHPRVAWLYRNLASNLNNQGRTDEAESLGREVLARMRRALGEDHTEVAQSWHFLCIVKRESGDPVAAEPLCRRAIEIQEAVPGGESPQLGRMWRELAWTYEDLGRAEERHEALLQCEAIFARHFPEGHPELTALREGLNVREEMGELGAGP